MSRDPQLRSGRVLRFGLAILGALTSSVAEKHRDTKIMERFACVDGRVDSDLQLVRSTSNACLNVETMASPANGGRIYVLAACQVGLKSVV